jgi:hypothetical protein
VTSQSILRRAQAQEEALIPQRLLTLTSLTLRRPYD